MLKITKNMF